MPGTGIYEKTDSEFSLISNQLEWTTALDFSHSLVEINIFPSLKYLIWNYESLVYFKQQKNQVHYNFCFKESSSLQNGKEVCYIHAQQQKSSSMKEYRFAPMEATPLEDKVSWRYCPNPTIMKQSREVICIHEFQAKTFFTPKVNLLYGFDFCLEAA